MSKLAKLILISTVLVCALATLVLAISNGVQNHTANNAGEDESIRDEIWTAPEDETVYGDANDDGVINTKDLIALRKYFANFNPETGESSQPVSKGADSNGDGIINTKDLIKLRKYFANFNPETGESSEVLGPNN